jgi:hypothetical protein
VCNWVPLTFPPELPRQVHDDSDAHLGIFAKSLLGGSPAFSRPQVGFLQRCLRNKNLGRCSLQWLGREGWGSHSPQPAGPSRLPWTSRGSHPRMVKAPGHQGTWGWVSHMRMGQQGISRRGISYPEVSEPDSGPPGMQGSGMWDPALEGL